MAPVNAHPLRRTLPRGLLGFGPKPGWKSAGVLAMLCSGVAWASLPRLVPAPMDQQRQWQALGVAPLTGGGVTGMPMAPTDAVEAVDFVPKRAAPVEAPPAGPRRVAAAAGPRGIRGRVGDGG